MDARLGAAAALMIPDPKSQTGMLSLVESPGTHSIAGPVRRGSMIEDHPHYHRQPRTAAPAPRQRTCPAPDHVHGTPAGHRATTLVALRFCAWARGRVPSWRSVFHLVEHRVASYRRRSVFKQRLWRIKRRILGSGVHRYRIADKAE